MGSDEAPGAGRRRLLPWVPGVWCVVLGYGGTLADSTGAWAIVSSALMMLGALGLFAGCVRALISYRRNRL